jgi:predicted amidohydrolase
VSAPRWAVAQPRMHWTLEGNLGEVLAALESAAAAGVDGCVCTELALTGFHRNVPEQLDRAALADAERQLREACARLGVCAVVGLPTLADGGRVFSSHLCIDASGRDLGRVHKRGLTPSEATFFTAGGPRGWTTFGGVLATSVLCREMLDGAALVPELAAALPANGARPRVIFWPSYISRVDAPLWQAYLEGATAMARALDAWVLHSNWAESLNEPGARGFGAGVVIAPDGGTLQTLPADAAAQVVVKLDSAAQARRISAA